MWRQLKGAFAPEPADMRLIFVPKLHPSESVEQYDNMTTALLKAGEGERVFLEPTGYNTVMDIPPAGDIVLITGNTEHSNMEHARVSETYMIATPNSADMYPTNAAAIALAVRYGQ